MIETRLDDWFVGRLENGLPARLPYDAHYSVGDSVQGTIIDFNLPAQQFIVSLDVKKPIRVSHNPIPSFSQCTILCQLPPYALAISHESNHLLHLPTFFDLNSFYSVSPFASYKRQEEIHLTSTDAYMSEQYHYIIQPSPSKKSSVQTYEAETMVPVTIVDVLPKQLNVKLNDGSRGRIHITELVDHSSPDQFQPLRDRYHQNQSFEARIIGTRNIEQNSKHQRPVYELSLREKSSHQYNIGDRIVGFVDKIDEKTKGHWFSLSLHLRGYVPPELLSKPLDIGQCCHLTIMNKVTSDKGEYYTLSTFEKNPSESTVVYAQFKEIKSINEFHFSIRKDEKEFVGSLVASDVSDVFEDFVFWKYLMNVRPPMLINGQANVKKELWKFRNKSIRAFVKSEDAETNQMVLSTRKSRFVRSVVLVVD